MTEAEWLGGWCYRRMYNVVRNQATTRQTRLYMAACCRLVEAEFFDPRILLMPAVADVEPFHFDAALQIDAPHAGHFSNRRTLRIR